MLRDSCLLVIVVFTVRSAFDSTDAAKHLYSQHISLSFEVVFMHQATVCPIHLLFSSLSSGLGERTR